MRFGGWCAAIAIAGVLALTAPAMAQTQAASGVSGTAGPTPGIELGGPAAVDPATAEKRREIERAYKDATAKIPAQQAGANDPWAGMRGDEPKPAAKAAKSAKRKQQ
jgi:hypothetical protein